MTNVPPDDRSPSIDPGSSPPPWQMRLGYELEEVYCAYAETRKNSPYLFSGREAVRIRDKGGWAADRLHEINVAPPLIEIFEDALEGIPTRENAPEPGSGTSSSIVWIVGRTRMVRRLDHLIYATRVAVGSSGGRYYDCGVMLCRIHVYNVITHPAATMPTDDREEVQRIGQVLQELITLADEHRPHDPEYLDLDRHLDELGEYLTIWRAKGANPDQSFFEQIDDFIRTTELAHVD